MALCRASGSVSAPTPVPGYPPQHVESMAQNGGTKELGWQQSLPQLKSFLLCKASGASRERHPALLSSLPAQTAQPFLTCSQRARLLSAPCSLRMVLPAQASLHFMSSSQGSPSLSLEPQLEKRARGGTVAPPSPGSEVSSTLWEGLICWAVRGSG